MPSRSPRALLLLAWLIGCGGEPPSAPPPDGALELLVFERTGDAPDVSRVTVTLSGPDMDTRTHDLKRDERPGAWKVQLVNIPSGPHHTLQVQAFNARNTLRSEGLAEEVGVTPSISEQVRVDLTRVEVAPVFFNEAPRIDSLVASATRVTPGSLVTLTVRAHDPNGEDRVSYAWAASAGSFSDSTGLTTTWTAPGTVGPVRLVFSVSDSRGATSTAAVWVVVLESAASP